MTQPYGDNDELWNDDDFELDEPDFEVDEPAEASAAPQPEAEPAPAPVSDDADADYDDEDDYGYDDGDGYVDDDEAFAVEPSFTEDEEFVEERAYEAVTPGFAEDDTPSFEDEDAEPGYEEDDGIEIELYADDDYEDDDDLSGYAHTEEYAGEDDDEEDEPDPALDLDLDPTPADKLDAALEASFTYVEAAGHDDSFEASAGSPETDEQAQAARDRYNRGAVEAMLFVSDEPVSTGRLSDMLRIPVGEMDRILQDIAREYEEQERGMQLREVAGGWRLYSHPAYHDVIERYVLSWDTQKLSQAALEALAVIAYNQPTTRAVVSSIRGVNSDAVISSLVEKGLVREAGRDSSVGQPILYATTRTFLEKFGLKSIKALPPLEDFAANEETRRLIVERLSTGAVTDVLDEPGDHGEELDEVEEVD